MKNSYSEHDLKQWITNHESAEWIRSGDLERLFTGMQLIRTPPAPELAAAVTKAIDTIETPTEAKGRVMAEMFWRGVYALQSALSTNHGGER